VSRRIFGLERNEVTGGWRKLHKDDEVGGACSVNTVEEDRIYFIDREARRKETTRKTKT
jgi:hypothetical protein